MPEPTEMTPMEILNAVAAEEYLAWREKRRKQREQEKASQCSEHCEASPNVRAA